MYKIDRFGNITCPNVGQIGLRGPQGYIGLDGLQGKQGPDGPIGPTGPDGDMGLDGNNGERGPMGPSGDMGLPGINGLPGKQGIRGPTGPSGNTGMTGPDIVSRVVTTGRGYRGNPASKASVTRGICYWILDNKTGFKNLCMPSYAMTGMQYEGGKDTYRVKCCKLNLVI
jgi:hypothetical protein